MNEIINRSFAPQAGVPANEGETSTDRNFNVALTYSPDLLQKMSQTTSINLLQAIIELIDNAKEATKDVGTVKVTTNPLYLENDCALVVCDDGHGMDEDNLKNLFFKVGIGDTEKSGIHARIGGRISISKLCMTGTDNNSKVVIYTKKENKPGIKVEWDGISPEISCSYCDSYTVAGEKIPLVNGTKIFFYNINLGYKNNDDLAVECFSKELKRKARVRYFPAIRNGFKLIINGETMTGEHPLYDELESEYSNIIKKTVTVKGPKDKKEYEVTYMLRDLSMFYDTNANNGNFKNGFSENNLHEWDKTLDDDSCRINEDTTSGMYIKVGDILIVTGGVVKPYINRKTHNQMNGKRVLLDIPVELANQLRFQNNKSEGFVDFDKTCATETLRVEMKRDLEALIQNHLIRTKNEREQEMGQCRKVVKTNSGETLTFRGIGENQKFPGFAIKNENDFTINSKSKLLKAMNNKKSFDATLGLISSIWKAFDDATYDAISFQPKCNTSLHPKTLANETKRQTLAFIREKFEENFMSMNSDSLM